MSVFKWHLRCWTREQSFVRWLQTLKYKIHQKSQGMSVGPENNNPLSLTSTGIDRIRSSMSFPLCPHPKKWGVETGGNQRQELLLFKVEESSSVARFPDAYPLCDFGMLVSQWYPWSKAVRKPGRGDCGFFFRICIVKPKHADVFLTFIKSTSVGCLSFFLEMVLERGGSAFPPTCVCQEVLSTWHKVGATWEEGPSNEELSPSGRAVSTSAGNFLFWKICIVFTFFKENSLSIFFLSCTSQPAQLMFILSK